MSFTVGKLLFLYHYQLCFVPRIIEHSHITLNNSALYYSSALFPSTNDFIYEQALQDYINQADNNEAQLDVTRLDQQDLGGMSYGENMQTYEYAEEDIQQIIPSREDFGGICTTGVYLEIRGKIGIRIKRSH